MIHFKQVGDRCEPEYIVIHTEDGKPTRRYGMIAWASDETFGFFPYKGHENLPADIMEGIDRVLEDLNNQYFTS